MNDDVKWGNWAKLLADEASSREEAEIDVSNRTDEQLMAEFNQAREAWDKASYAARANAIDSERAYGNIMKRINAPTISANRKVWYYMAAALITAIVAIGVSLWMPLGQNGSAQNIQLAHASVDVLSLKLADGTGVDLNKGSRLAYPATFDGNLRLVELSGEAFFNVAPDKSKPFIINAGDVNIKVVGTSFNVKSAEQSQIVEVTVREGVVEVMGKNDKVVLTQGQVAVFNAATGSITKGVNINANYNAWLTKVLLFDEMPLSQVFEVLDNVYHVKFVANNPQLLKLKWTASFKQQDAEFVAQSLALTFNLKVTQTEGSFMFD